MGAVVGTEERKPSAETGPRIPRPGAAVRSNAAPRKTMSGVAPAANPPPFLVGAPLPFSSRDDTHAEARVERPADAGSGHDDAATAHGLPPDMAQALADLSRDRAPPSKPPVSVAPATKRMASNAPIAPRAPSIAPPPSVPRSGPSVAPSASPSLSASLASSPKPRSPTLPPPLPASPAAPHALPLPPSMASAAGAWGSPMTALPMRPSYAPDPMAPSYALAQPSQPPPQQASWAPPPMHPSHPPPHASWAPAELPMPSTPRAFAPPSHQNVAAPFAGPNGYGNAGDEESAPLTYQVYAPDSVPPPRPMNISRMSMPDFAPKPNIKARIILGIAAACVFIGTAILIIVGASDDPPRAKAAAGVATATNAATSAVAATPLVAPLIIAPPVVDPPPAASAAVADPPPAPVAKAKASKAKASSSAGARGAALPPNPFAAGSPVKPAKKK